MARNVADLAFYLGALAGPDSRSPISITESGSQFAGDLGRDFKGVRVAWFKDLGGVPFERAILESVNAQRKVFESLGCIVEEAEPDFTGAAEAYHALRALGYVGAHAEHVNKHRELMKDTIQWQVEEGRKLTADQIVRATTLRAQLWERMRVFMDRYEYFILPTTQVLPFDLRQPYITEIEGVKMPSYIDWMKSCFYITVVETPAISLPCGFTRAESGMDLPISLNRRAASGQGGATCRWRTPYEQASGVVGYRRSASTGWVAGARATIRPMPLLTWYPLANAAAVSRARSPASSGPVYCDQRKR